MLTFVFSSTTCPKNDLSDYMSVSRHSDPLSGLQCANEFNAHFHILIGRLLCESAKRS